MANRNSTFVLPMAISAWVMAALAGLLLLGAYDAQPGDQGVPSERWPVGSRIADDPDRPELLIFLHPRCPCSRSSVEELAEALDGVRDRVAVHAVLLRFDDRRDEPGSDLGHLVERRLGVRATPDPGGAESRRFGVATSGHVLLFGVRGDRQFSGGITPSRGHRGANVGREAIRALLWFGQAASPNHPVFGCSLTSNRRERLP